VEESEVVLQVMAVAAESLPQSAVYWVDEDEGDCQVGFRFICSSSCSGSSRCSISSVISSRSCSSSRSSCVLGGRRCRGLPGG
jgi:hypothetical protein